MFKNINCKKYILVALSLVFVITGIILIIIGSNINQNYYDYSIFLVSEFQWLALTLMAIGAIAIILAFLISWAALKENYCFNLIFCILLFLTTLLALITGSYGYILKTKMKKFIEDRMASSMLEYKPNEPNVYSWSWDYLQKQFSCCGLDSYKDWENLFGNQIPISCCFMPSAVVGNFSCTVNNDDVNRSPWGCLSNFYPYIETQTFNMGTCGIVMGVILLIGVLFSYYYGRSLKKTK